MTTTASLLQEEICDDEPGLGCGVPRMSGHFCELASDRLTLIKYC
jgi:hypothetical protein